MNKDFKPRNSAAARPRGGGLLLGLFIGFILGLGVAAAIAVYVFKSPVPFVNKGNPPKPGASDAGTVGKAARPEEKPRFDFYRILPGQEEPVTDKQLREAAKQAAPATPAAPGSAPNSPATVASPSGPQDIYFIQAGAFQNPADADNLKAKLALLGLEASVEPTDVPDKGTWYRVRMGPFSRIEEINRVRGQLAQNGIDGSLVKIKDPSAKP
ncbi:MAG TPA: SPOR domain-containing protein [Burkholderiales bacterium]|nr:SPOR domain-containing protein [Burkholderiales bacterium]